MKAGKRNLFLHWGNADVTFGPTDMPQMGKRPSLMVTRGSCSRKVASFQSVESARYFMAAVEEVLSPFMGKSASDDV